MKPTKNKVFCVDCGRSKMLFETEKKANNFIKFNQDEIKLSSGVAPQRAYYCMFCDGWHTTSIKHDIGISKKEEIFNEILNKKSLIKSKVPNLEKLNESVSKFEDQIKGLNVNEIEIFFNKTIDKLNYEINKIISSIDSTERKRLKEFRRDLNSIYSLRSKYGFKKTIKDPREKEINSWLFWYKKTNK